MVNTVADNGDPDPRPEFAADINGKTSLRAAIEDANGIAGPHIINFGPFEIGGDPWMINLGKPLPVLSEDICISGPTPDLVTVQRAAGAAKFRIFEVGPGTECNISNLSIRNGHVEGVDSKGGGVLNNGSLGLAGCKIIENKAGSGGGVASTGEQLDMSDCDVYQNAAEVNHGGGVYVANGIFSDGYSLIHNNTAMRSGGGVYLSNVTADFHQPDIFANTAKTMNGGGLYLTVCQGGMSEGQVWGNMAAGNGGGICNRGDGIDTFNLTEMEIHYNQASGNGGGIYLENDEMHLQDVTVEGNDCGLDGGGIYQESGTLSSQGLIVQWNRALGLDSYGGEFFIRTGTVSLNIAYLGNNTAWDYAGGAICQGVAIVLLANAGPQTIGINVIP